ncbi:alkaline phosphatase family protein [Burkholderia ubonensis]|uniref:alkaline phosphatase family protein n=1 Tax=Burkholderia ubonensis TaxID=101571 RepID=UPI0009B305DF|nr:alkaline phosphatase family protein [Burkholderia ubonensis]
MKKRIVPGLRCGLALVRQTFDTCRCLVPAAALCACANQAVRAAAAELDIPPPDHVVIVIEENKSYSSIIGSDEAPYINSLARQGAVFSQSFALAHPSQPNYLALFSGSTHGITDDSCPHTLAGDNLGTLLLQAGRSIAVYSESIPSAGYTGCEQGLYARKHNPAANWQGVNLAASANLSFESFDLAHLPTVSIVVPNMKNDMHSDSVRVGDDWLRKHISRYVDWARTHNGLLIVTWDEGGKKSDNRIPTIFVGPMVKPGIYNQRIDHYSILATIADMYHLRRLGDSRTSAPVKDIWNNPHEAVTSTNGAQDASHAATPSR